MIICICCNINEQKITEMLDAIERPTDVHRNCDSCVQCGKCLPAIKQMMEKRDGQS